MNQSRI